MSECDNDSLSAEVEKAISAFQTQLELWDLLATSMDNVMQAKQVCVQLLGIFKTDKIMVETQRRIATKRGAEYESNGFASCNRHDAQRHQDGNRHVHKPYGGRRTDRKAERFDRYYRRRSQPH